MQTDAQNILLSLERDRDKAGRIFALDKSLLALPIPSNSCIVVYDIVLRSNVANEHQLSGTVDVSLRYLLGHGRCSVRRSTFPQCPRII